MYSDFDEDNKLPKTSATSSTSRYNLRRRTSLVNEPEAPVNAGMAFTETMETDLRSSELSELLGPGVDEPSEVGVDNPDGPDRSRSRERGRLGRLPFRDSHSVGADAAYPDERSSGAPGFSGWTERRPEIRRSRSVGQDNDDTVKLLSVDQLEAIRLAEGQMSQEEIYLLAQREKKLAEELN